MAVNKYGAMHRPKIVRFAGGSARSTIKMPAVDSAAFYVGSFVTFIEGAAATLDGAEYGPSTFTDDDRYLGFVVGFSRMDSLVPIQDDPQRSGTVTDPSGEIPMKYTFAATNDEGNTTSAILELVEVMPIMPGDVLEVSLWGAGTTSVARGTTVAAGTTDSTDNIGVGVSIDGTYNYAVTESSGDKDLENKDFITVSLDGHKPANTHRVYLLPLRSVSKTAAND